MAAPSARELADARWWPGPGLGAEGLAALLARAGVALAAGAIDLKSSRRKALYPLALGAGAVDHLLKVNDYRGVAWLRRLRRSKSRRELARARAAAARGVPTPVPAAAGELRRAGVLQRCYLLVPRVPGAVDLLVMHRERLGDARERRAWTRELGALTLRMHCAGVYQADLAPNNFLWRPAPSPRLWAVDFERVRLSRPLSRTARRLLLAKLDRHFADASAAGRMRFLVAYTAGDRSAARSWWRALEAYAPHLARRDLAHWRRTALRASRRFAPVEQAGFSGWARREAPLGDLSRALEAERESAVWVHALGAAGVRSAGRAWSLAQVLWQRALSPLPLALLRRGGEAWLLFARAPGGQRLAGADPGAARRALALALDRLLALGADCEDLEPDDFVLECGPLGVRRARLLEVRALDGRGGTRPTPRRWARALADRLVAGS